MNTLGQQLLDFYLNLQFPFVLPVHFRVMNPFHDDRVRRTISAFYLRYLNSSIPHRVLMGINPGRHGGGITGIPFTDTKRLTQVCQIAWDGPSSHEPSSEFFYAMATAHGTVDDFYAKFFSFPVSPLGYLRQTSSLRWVNANYYDSPSLLQATHPFIIDCLNHLIHWPVDRNLAFCLGQGPNYKILVELNQTYHWFDRIEALPHPRFIIQYKRKEILKYIDLYWKALLSH